jgi:hypothetical protein
VEHIDDKNRLESTLAVESVFHIWSKLGCNHVL